MVARLEQDPNFHDAMRKVMAVWRSEGRLPQDLENFLSYVSEPGGMSKLFEAMRDGGYLPALLAGAVGTGYVLDEDGI